MDKRIFFDRPNHHLLNSIGHSLVDMHFHTRYSDSNVKVRNVLKKAKELGIGVAITDHNEIEGAVKAFKNDMGVMIVPGIEVSCKEGAHILLYFYDINEYQEFFEKKLKNRRNGNPNMATDISVAELLDLADDYNCIKVAAHPYGYLTANCGLQKCINKAYVDEKVMDNIDGIEVINGAMSRKLNNNAVRLSNMTQKMITAGSDGHALMHLGRIVTATKTVENHKEFLDNIKNKDNIVIGKEIVKIKKLVDASVCAKSHWIDHPVPSMKIMGKHYYARAVHLKHRVVNKIKSVSVVARKKL